MSGVWQLYAAGSPVATLDVWQAPTLALTKAVRLEVNPHTGAAQTSGDGRYNPAPIRLRAYLEAEDGEAALAALADLRAAARSADELRYTVGTAYVTRAGNAAALNARLGRLGVGVIELELQWLPTEPYWRNASGEAVMMP